MELTLSSRCDGCNAMQVAVDLRCRRDASFFDTQTLRRRRSSRRTACRQVEPREGATEAARLGVANGEDPSARTYPLDQVRAAATGCHQGQARLGKIVLEVRPKSVRCSRSGRK
jgi:hypothetical protein